MNESPSPKDLQREYLRAWRRKNPDKVKQYNRDYWRRKAKKLSEGSVINEKAEP